jgi:hypothetical protein
VGPAAAAVTFGGKPKMRFAMFVLLLLTYTLNGCASGNAPPPAKNQPTFRDQPGSRPALNSRIFP